MTNGKSLRQADGKMLGMGSRDWVTSTIALVLVCVALRADVRAQNDLTEGLELQLSGYCASEVPVTQSTFGTIATTGVVTKVFITGGAGFGDNCIGLGGLNTNGIVRVIHNGIEFAAPISGVKSFETNVFNGTSLHGDWYGEIVCLGFSQCIYEINCLCTNPAQICTYDWASPFVSLGIAYTNAGNCTTDLALAYGGKFSRVDMHGIPMPEESPTQKTEVDQDRSALHVDTYSLGPYLSTADVRLPIEGGDLALEFRRSAHVTSYRESSIPEKLPLTHPSDRLLGPGWHTNLSSHIAIRSETCLQTQVATVFDEVGTSYRFIDHGLAGEQNPLPPDTSLSLNNRAESAVLHRQDFNTLILRKPFGTKLSYQRLGTFFAPGGGADNAEEYFRLASIEDRNGNRVDWTYWSNDPLLRESFHVAEMVEQAHPERRISFEYQLGTGGNGTDWGDRLVGVRDALGRETRYEYGDAADPDAGCLKAVSRAEVLDGETGALASPRTEFAYFTTALPVEEATHPSSPPPTDPLVKNRLVALASITDPRGHVTSLSYAEGYFPSSIGQGAGPSKFAPTIFVDSLSTADGIVRFERVAASHESVITEVTDTRGKVSTFAFSGATGPAPNLIGKALYITELSRATELGTVHYAWSDDSFANLLAVQDLNGNTVEFEYETAIARKSDQPTKETLTDIQSGASIETAYEYASFSRLQQVTDGEAKVTAYSLDGAGNRVECNEELGKQTRYTFSSDGFVEAVVDPDGRRTESSREFFPADLEHYYAVTETVLGYGNELNLQTVRTYDVMGNLVGIRDPNQNVYAYQYDALNRLVARTEPLSGTATTTHTLNGDPVADTDFLGNVTIRTYDSLNRVIEERRRMTSPSVNSADDIVTSYTYGQAGELTSTMDPEGTRTRHAYDAALRRTESHFDADELDHSELYEYGANSGSGAFSYTEGFNPTRVTNRRGFHTDTSYDGFYRPVRTIRRYSPETAHAAAPEPNEPVTEYAYNRAHKETRRTVHGEKDTGGHRVQYTLYDDLHRVVGTVVDFDSDENEGSSYGGPSGIIGSGVGYVGDPDDQLTLYAFDLRGNPVGVIDPNSHLTETIFDGANRPVLVRQPAVLAGIPETWTEYDSNGNPVKVVDPKGNETLVEYDARNRETMRILDLDGDGEFEDSFAWEDIVTVREYDLMDNVTARVDSTGQRYEFVFDRAYREITRFEPEVVDPENGNIPTRPTWRTAYDKNSNRRKLTDPRLIETHMAYDGLNRLALEIVAVETPEFLARTYEHDENGNLKAQSLDNGDFGVQRTEFTYDPFDRQLTETWPGKRITTQAYFRNGLLRQRIDPKGQTADHTYDVAGRLLTSTYAASDDNASNPPVAVEEVQVFAYDMASNLLSAQDRYGASFREYDSLHRLTAESRDYANADTGAAYSYSILHDYDLNGNQSESTYPATGRIVQRGFDRGGRLTQVLDLGTISPNDNYLTSYAYDTNGNVLLAIAPNGVQTARTYDALNRTIASGTTKNQKRIYKANYSYDLVGNRLVINEGVQGQPYRLLEYQYDAQYRLTEERVEGVPTAYTYDAAGNRLTTDAQAGLVEYLYNERNELLEMDGGSDTATFVYDLNGNLVERSGQSATRTFAWDTRNRLVGASENASPIFAAEYDYRGRRLLKEESGVATFHAYSESLVLQELNLESGKVLKDFVHGIDLGGGVGSILHTVRRPSTGGQPSAQRSYDFFCSNHSGHTVALTSFQGVPAQTELFDAFGASVSTTGSSNNTRKAYTKERDVSLGLDNHGLRYYDATTGRYISRDPAGYVDGLNAYLHTANNPVNRFDPHGLFWEWLEAAASKLGGESGQNISRPTVLEQIATSDAADTALGGAERVAALGLGVANALTLGASKFVAESAADTTYDLGGWFRAGEVGATGAMLGQSLWQVGSRIARGIGAKGIEEGSVRVLSDLGGRLARVLRDETGAIGTWKAARGGANAYSVAFEATIAKAGAGTRGAHFKAANEILLAEMKANPQFADVIKGLGVNVPTGSTGAALGKSPGAWTWHHAIDQPGVMQLVPKVQHQGSAWQPLLHPSGVGGFKLWGAGF